MSNSDETTQPVQRGGGAKPKKKAPNHFKAVGSSLVAGLLAGADQVAERSFLGGANLDSDTPSPAVQAPPKSGRSVPPQAANEAPTAAPAPAAPAPAASPVSDAPADADTDSGDGAGDNAGGGATKAPATRRTAAPDGVRQPDRAVEVPSAAPAPAAVEPKAVVREAAASAVEPKKAVVREAAPAPLRRDPAPADDEASSPRRRMRGSGKPWAHAAVHESFASAKIRSEGWTSYGFRLDPEVLAELKARIKTDRRTSGNPLLSQGHYLDAALRHIPEDVESQIAMAQAFLDERMGVVEAGKQSTFRVGPEAYALVSSLNQGLQEADYGRRGLYVVSAALEILMQAMDAEGELRRPERRTRVPRPASS